LKDAEHKEPPWQGDHMMAGHVDSFGDGGPGSG
jgi:hypothetical protein